jgi:hypothetical protein
MATTILDAVEINRIRNLLESERRKSLSEREWQHRLRGYGYGMKSRNGGRVLTLLPNNVELFELD